MTLPTYAIVSLVLITPWAEAHRDKDPNNGIVGMIQAHNAFASKNSAKQHASKSYKNDEKMHTSKGFQTQNDEQLYAPTGYRYTILPNIKSKILEEADYLFNGGLSLTFSTFLLVGFIAPAFTMRMGFVQHERPNAQSHTELGSSSERQHYLDLWRVLCINCVLITHSNEEYANYNVMGVQQWVLQIIVLISAKCFTKSHTPVAHYIARLLFLFSLGSSLNWASKIATGANWWANPFVNIPFQMGFVLIIGLAAFISAPMKAQIQRGNAKTARWNSIILTCIIGFILLLRMFSAKLKFTTQEFRCFEDQVPRLMLWSVLTLLGAMVGVQALPESQQGLVGWILMAWIYGTRILHQEPRPGSEFHLLDLFIFGVFIELVPLHGQAKIGAAFTRWWPIWVFGCGLLLQPGTRRRWEQYPSDEILDRFCFYVVEAIVVIAFTSIPLVGPQNSLVIPELIQKNLPWLNQWSLFAYLSHFAFYTLVPYWPWNTLAVFLSASLFFAAHTRTSSILSPEAKWLKN